MKRLLLTVVLCGGVALDAHQVFRAGVDLTNFAVTVTDRKGNIVPNLTRDDFEVVEDGQVQSLRYFVEGDGDSAPPMHLGLMVDASGSMQNASEDDLI